MTDALTEPAKLLLLAALLTNDKIISNNGKSFLKEMILRRDTRVAVLLKKFEVQNAGDSSFLESLHELIMTEAQTLYNELFFDTSLEVGKTLSKAERDTKNLAQEKSLIYGEVEFASFYRVLRKINPAPGKVFYDLGSGTGKAVFAARFAYDFSKCIGIEILSGLHGQAEVVLNRYNAQFKTLLALGQSQHAMVYEGSFLDFDWSDGDVVFANSTCFDDSLMLSLSHMAERLSPGSIVVTFTKGMTSTSFELLERKRYRMSWGPATVFIHRRLNLDGSAVGPNTLNVLPSDDVTYDDDLKNHSIDSIDHGHTAHDYSSKDSEASEEEEDEEEEESDNEDEDADYDDDIDMYIKQGFDMDPDAEGEDKEEDEEDDENDDDDGDEGSEENSGSGADNDNDGDEDDNDDEGDSGSDRDTPRTHQSPHHHHQSPSYSHHHSTSSSHAEHSRPATAPSSQQQQHAAHSAGHAVSPTEERLNTIMEKIAERRKVIDAMTGGTVSASNSPAVNRNNRTGESASPQSSGASPSPSRVLRYNSAATPPSAGRGNSHAAHSNIARSPATSSFSPPRSPTAVPVRTPPSTKQSANHGTDLPSSADMYAHKQSSNFGHTITVEAPMSANRRGGNNLNMLSMRSPGPSIPLNLSTSSLNSAGADSPGAQMNSPLDSALLNRKRASAVSNRVPMSAFSSPFREDF